MTQLQCLSVPGNERVTTAAAVLLLDCRRLQVTMLRKCVWYCYDFIEFESSALILACRSSLTSSSSQSTSHIGAASSPSATVHSAGTHQHTHTTRLNEEILRFKFKNTLQPSSRLPPCTQHVYTCSRFSLCVQGLGMALTIRPDFGGPTPSEAHDLSFLQGFIDTTTHS